MPPTWTPCVTFVHPPVLTRSQGRLCQAIQREFVESLIRELGILQFPCLIFQFLVPLTEDDWDHVVRWGRTTLPHGRFQGHNEISSVTSVVSRP